MSTAVDVFRNHTEFCARLQRLVLAREKPIISVTGRRGIGKSGLVAKVLSDFEEPNDSTDHQVNALAYFSTRTGGGVLDFARIFHGLADLLPPGQRDRLEEQWTTAGADVLPNLFTALRDRKVVLVLDNLDDLQDPESGRLTNNDLIAFLTAVCSHRHRPVVITTSQRPLELPPGIGVHVSRIEIDKGLELEEAVELLRQYDADGEAGLRNLPDAELRQAVERVYGMPRGLELLVVLMKERQMATLQRIFDDRDTPERLLGQLVSAGFQSLDAVGRDVLLLLALADTPLPVDALPEILEGKHPPSVVAQTVEQLVKHRMIGFDRPTQMARLHPIDSDYVRGTLLDDPQQRAALDLRLADWLATQRFDPLTWRTSTHVKPQLREINHRLRAGDGHRAIHVIADIAGFLGGRGELAQLKDVLAQAQSYANTPDTRAAYELSRGWVEFVGGSLEEAVAAYRTGRDAAEQTSDHLLVARLNISLGNTLRHMGDPAAAWEPLAQASTLPPTDQASRAIVLQALFLLGVAACYLNDVGGAADAAARCEALLRPDDPSQWGAWLADLRALIALLKGDYTAALTEVERGIHRYADSPEQVTIGYLVNVRGLVLLAQGRTKEAAQEFVTVLEDAIALRQVRLEGFAALNLAWTRLIEGDRIAAATMAREAADRLDLNRVREADSAVALMMACEASGVDTRLGLLRKAVQESRGNPDLYQPSDKILVNLVQASIMGSLLACMRPPEQ